jgi:hypothetical protein
LWRSSEPPILLVPLIYQWSEVALQPISTIWLRKSLDELSMRGANLDQAAYYGFSAVVLLAFGMRLAMGVSRRSSVLQDLFANADRLTFKAVGPAAFMLIAVGYGAAFVSGQAGPARELFNAVAGLKSVGVFILAFWCLKRGQHMGLLGAVISFEVLFGMTGFFAEFKNSLLTLLAASIIAQPKLSRASLFGAVSAALLLVSVAVFWSAIKSDYRSFINQGTGAQVIERSLEQRIDFIVGEAATFSEEKVKAGLDALVSRHGYIDYLAQTMEFVPAGYPHENGALTLAVIQHIAQPRFLFPDKPPLPNDTEVMARYTGQGIMWNEDTSISIGYLAELYVDFGYTGGLVAVLVLGFLVGSGARIIGNDKTVPTILSAGLVLMMILPLAYFGTAYVKLVAPIVFAFAVCLLFQRVGWRMVPAMRPLGGLVSTGWRRRRGNASL